MKKEYYQDICPFCLDSQGDRKFSYKTLEIAKNSAEYSNSKLKIYWCPSGEGWHLTSK